jgi:hypothetical protein
MGRNITYGFLHDTELLHIACNLSPDERSSTCSLVRPPASGSYQGLVSLFALKSCSFTWSTKYPLVVVFLHYYRGIDIPTYEAPYRFCKGGINAPFNTVDMAKPVAIITSKDSRGIIRKEYLPLTLPRLIDAAPTEIKMGSLDRKFYIHKPPIDNGCVYFSSIACMAKPLCHLSEDEYLYLGLDESDVEFELLEGYPQYLRASVNSD